jgi:hypothetical protein
VETKPFDFDICERSEQRQSQNSFLVGMRPRPFPPIPSSRTARPVAPPICANVAFENGSRPTSSGAHIAARHRLVSSFGAGPITASNSQRDGMNQYRGRGSIQGLGFARSTSPGINGRSKPIRNRIPQRTVREQSSMKVQRLACRVAGSFCRTMPRRGKEW